MWVWYKGMARDDLGSVVATVYPASKVHKVSAFKMKVIADIYHRKWRK